MTVRQRNGHCWWQFTVQEPHASASAATSSHRSSAAAMAASTAQVRSPPEPGCVVIPAASQLLGEPISLAGQLSELLLGLFEQVPQRRRRPALAGLAGRVSGAHLAAGRSPGPAGPACRPGDERRSLPPTSSARRAVGRRSPHRRGPPHRPPSARGRPGRGWRRSTHRASPRETPPAPAACRGPGRWSARRAAARWAAWPAVATSCSRRRSPPESICTGDHIVSRSNQNRSHNASSVQSGVRVGPATTWMARALRSSCAPIWSW